jgi:cyclin-dependent kinase 8/11
VQYPIRPVDTTTDFEGTTSLQPNQPVSANFKEPQLLVRCDKALMWNLVTGTVMQQISVFQPSGNAPPGSQSVLRPMRQMQHQQPMVGMPRVPAGANMAAFNAASQAGMAGLNPGNIPMQRGAGGQSHPHQVLFVTPIT